MAKRKDSSKKKRKGSGNGLLIAAVLLTILFLAGVMSLGALGRNLQVMVWKAGSKGKYADGKRENL